MEGPAVGNIDKSQGLTLRWAEVANDPSLKDLPYKIELNAWGKVEMSPASYRHGRLQGYIIAALSRQLQGGAALGEVPILTDIGVRVPDVAWASDAFIAAARDISPLPTAPEICIEIVSASNSDTELREKTRAYLVADAHEVWLVEVQGSIRYFDALGERAVSGFSVQLSIPLAAKEQ
jgi:Uma2 family endonuclease